MTRALWTLTALALWTGCSSAQDDATTPTATADAATDTATGDVAETSEATQGSDADALPTPQWTAATHGKGTAPNYATVLPTDTVQRLDIVIAASDWATLQAELATYASSSSGPGPGGPPGGGGSLDQAFDPSWVPCDVFHAGRQWYKVGIRPKGNSSLQQTVKSGNKKTSFKLDFDQFEDTWPEVTNQRFYGFKQLNVNNNFDDQTLLRERVAGDLFRAFGVPSARSAFYEVYLDVGQGPTYFGLYTVIEEVDDTVIETQFESAKGNVYKPEGDAATFAVGTFDTAELYLKNNEAAADFADAKALYDALHSGLRTTDAAAWRVGLEQILDVERFLKWLAANTVLQNWDTYGRMSHNYYLYADPTTQRFVWIPWDNNEALQTGKMGGAIPLNLSGVGSGWPLIQFIAADPVYYAHYKQHVHDFATQVFEPTAMQATYDKLKALVAPSAAKEQAGYTFLKSVSAFESAIAALKTHVQARNSAALAL
jgi:spore coat protein H